MHFSQSVSLGAVREELEVQNRAVLARVDALAQQSFHRALLDVFREVCGCTSIAEIRELFVDQDGIASYDEDTNRILRRCHESFRAGIHAGELVQQVEHELKQSAAEVLRALSYRATK